MEEGAGGRGKESEAAAGAADTAEAVREGEKDMESVGEKEWKNGMNVSGVIKLRAINRSGGGGSSGDGTNERR